ncbi:hypothetical protein ACFQY7_32030 [Actinomadura luteofluorescens]|uniref:hypothetical protein n=1 Tax=Actinomadura luteofluorescens TaxID=46163 RepID=UPI0036308561
MHAITKTASRTSFCTASAGTTAASAVTNASLGTCRGTTPVNPNVRRVNAGSGTNTMS